jgi:arylsulfatase I/J
LFLFVAWQNNHPPLQVPEIYVQQQRTKALQTKINGMTTFMDEAIGNVTDKLKERGMWNNTLIIFSGDNGGYLNNGGNNTPFRGAKFSDFEGGTRVPAFVSGGLLSSSLRGKSTSELIHIADWGATLCELAGGSHKQCTSDELASKADLPQPDGISIARFLIGETSHVNRTEVPLSVFTVQHRANILSDRENATRAILEMHALPDLNYFVGGEALIMGDWKLIVGQQHNAPFSHEVNVTCDDIKVTGNDGWNTIIGAGVPCTCGVSGCLYNISADPHEIHNIAASHPDVLKKMNERLSELRQTVYAPDRGNLDVEACTVVHNKYHGFWGPWL